MNDIYAIIVAAGTGTRFGSDIPKQFLPLGKDRKPVLMHTILAFQEAGIKTENIRVTLHAEMTGFWEELCREHGFLSPPVVVGGETRFHSVQNTLKTIDCEPFATIMIHDGVRPLIPKEVIERVLETICDNETVIPAVPVTDSIRLINSDGESHSVDRSKYVSVQTPQAFKAGILFKAYNEPYSPIYTDDASVVEKVGARITLTMGSYDNIKITTPKDLLIAEEILKEKQ